MEVPFSSEEFINKNPEDLAEEAFQVAMGNFKRKMEHVQEVAMPVIKQVYENQGQMYERIVVPLTDGRKMYNIPCNLKEAYDTECKSVVKEFHRRNVERLASYTQIPFNVPTSKNPSAVSASEVA